MITRTLIADRLVRVSELPSSFSTPVNTIVTIREVRRTGAVALPDRGTVESVSGRQSDRLGEFGECRSHPRSPRSMDGEFVVATAEILHEGVPCVDHLCCVVRSQPTHRSQLFRLRHPRDAAEAREDHDERTRYDSTQWTKVSGGQPRSRKVGQIRAIAGRRRRC
jgi:hypothetical protein